jgi:hypothetical protein
MDRRNFVTASALAGIAATSGAVSAATFAFPSCVLSTPKACVGATYTLANGVSLTVSRVEALASDAQWQQWHVSFESNAPIEEGVHALQSQSAGVSDTQLFLQGSGNHWGANISRRN